MSLSRDCAVRQGCRGKCHAPPDFLGPFFLSWSQALVTFPRARHFHQASAGAVRVNLRFVRKNDFAHKKSCYEQVCYEHFPGKKLCAPCSCIVRRRKLYSSYGPPGLFWALKIKIFNGDRRSASLVSNFLESTTKKEISPFVYLPKQKNLIVLGLRDIDGQSTSIYSPL